MTLTSAPDQTARAARPRHAPPRPAPAAYTPWRDDASAMAQSGPRFFGPAARPVFGWYHAPAGVARGEAVVLCPSVGPESLSGYRTLRALAERLAADGFAVLRLDWPGTGDSAGDAGDPGCPSASAGEWRRALGQAVERARAWSGAGRATVVGLRAGALFAADAGALGADRVVLWWPPASGRQFLRELRARHALAEHDHDRYAPPSGDPGLAAGSFESDGAVLAPGLAGELGGMGYAADGESPAEGAGAAEALVVVPADGPPGRAAAALAARGLAVDVRPAAGHEALRHAAMWVDVPAEGVAAVAGWLAERADAAADGASGASTSLAPPGSDELPGVTAASLDGAREECVLFGAEGRVAGVLTVPAGGPAGRAPRPPVLLLHTGGDHRVGPNRMWPVWARRWAQEGVTTLRFDPAGLGDTPAEGGDEHKAPEPYGEGRGAEVAAAAAYLCERTGAEGVVLVGLCSGGYYAVRGVAAGAAAAGVIAINAQLYAGHEELNNLVAVGHRAPARLGVSARDPERWRRMLRGEIKVWRVGIMVVDGVRHTLRAAAAIAAQEARRLAVAARLVRRAERTTALADLWRVGLAGVPLSMVFSHEDDGWAYLRVQARAAWRTFRRKHRPRVHVVEGAAHTFVRPWMQRRLYELVTAELRGMRGGCVRPTEVAGSPGEWPRAPLGGVPLRSRNASRSLGALASGEAR